VLALGSDAVTVEEASSITEADDDVAALLGMDHRFDDHEVAGVLLRSRLLRRRDHGRVAFADGPNRHSRRIRWAPMPKKMAVGSAGQRGDRDHLVHPQHRHHIEPRG